MYVNVGRYTARASTMTFVAIRFYRVSVIVSSTLYTLSENYNIWLFCKSPSVGNFLIWEFTCIFFDGLIFSFFPYMYETAKDTEM